MERILRGIREYMEIVEDSRILVEEYRHGKVRDWNAYDSEVSNMLKRIKSLELPEGFVIDEEKIYIPELRKIAQERGIV